MKASHLILVGILLSSLESQGGNGSSVHAPAAMHLMNPISESSEAIELDKINKDELQKIKRITSTRRFTPIKIQGEWITPVSLQRMNSRLLNEKNRYLLVADTKDGKKDFFIQVKK